MQTFNQAIEAVESYSPAEEQFNRRRRTAGLVAAPAAFLLLWMLPLPLPVAAHRMAAVMALPVIPFLLLFWFDLTKSAQCGGYCVVSVVAMLALMLYRRDEYSSSM